MEEVPEPGPIDDLRNEVVLLAAEDLRDEGLEWVRPERLERGDLVGAYRRESVVLIPARLDWETVNRWRNHKDIGASAISLRVLWAYEEIEADLGQGPAAYYDLGPSSRVEIKETTRDDEPGLMVTFTLGIWSVLNRLPYSTKAPPSSSDQILFG